MNPIQYYMHKGLPATGQVTFNRMPNTQPESAATLSVTINGVAYTWYPPGTTLTGTTWFIGTTNTEMAKSLAAAINADRSRSDITGNSNPISPFYALYYNNIVTIISTVPGLVGNSITLAAASSDSTCYTLSGSTLTAGATEFSNVARTNLVVAAPGGSNGTAQISVTSKKFQAAYFYGVKSWSSGVATANAATVYIGEKDGAGTFYSDPVLSSLIPTIVNAPQDSYLDLINFWLLAPTSGDAVFVKYL